MISFLAEISPHSAVFRTRDLYNTGASVSDGQARSKKVSADVSSQTLTVLPGASQRIGELCTLTLPSCDNVGEEILSREGT